MPEILLTNWVTTVPKYLKRYGKIIALRFDLAATIADAKYLIFQIKSGNGQILYFKKLYMTSGASSGVQVTDWSFKNDFLDIDIDYDTQFVITADVGNYEAAVLILNIIPTQSGRTRQFHDKLSGINSYET